MYQILKPKSKFFLCISEKIAKWNKKIVISFIYVCTEPLKENKLEKAKNDPKYNPATDIHPTPVFVLRRCKKSKNNMSPCRIFIDQDLRVYTTWIDYMENNKLGKCEMIVPKDGKYQGNSSGEVILHKLESPACSISSDVLRVTDTASVGVGLASGGIFLASAIPAIAVAPVALTAAAIGGIGVGIYSIVRSSFSLYDRSSHQQVIIQLQDYPMCSFKGIIKNNKLKDFVQSSVKLNLPI